MRVSIDSARPSATRAARGGGTADAASHIMTPEIRFLGMAPSGAVEAVVQMWAKRLENVYDKILRCEVIIDQPHRSTRQGRMFDVRVEVTVPDRIITASQDPGLDRTHEDVYIAIADAFHAARRQLQDHARIRRGDTKHHGLGA
jgi:ribosome-associated translation inhibitor RaiA